MKNSKKFFLDFVEENSKLIFNSDEKKELVNIFKDLYKNLEMYYKSSQVETLKNLDTIIDNVNLYVNEKKTILIYWIQLENGEKVVLKADEVQWILDMDDVKKNSKGVTKIICGNYFYRGDLEEKPEKIIRKKLVHISKDYSMNNKENKDDFLKKLNKNSIDHTFIFEDNKDKFEIEYYDNYIITKIKKFNISELNKYIDKVITLTSKNEELIKNVKEMASVVRNRSFDELAEEVYIRFLYGAIMNNYKNKSLTIQKLMNSYALKKFEEIKEELINIYQNFIGKRFYKFYREYFYFKTLTEEEIYIIHSKLIIYLMTSSFFIFSKRFTMELIYYYLPKEEYSEISNNIKKTLMTIIVIFLDKKKKITIKYLEKLLKEDIMFNKCNESEKKLISELFFKEKLSEEALMKKEKLIEEELMEKEKLIEEALMEKEKLIEEALMEKEKLIEEALMEKEKLIEEALMEKEKLREEALMEKEKLIEEALSQKKLNDFYERIYTLDDEDENTYYERVINEYKNLIFFNVENKELMEILEEYFEHELDDEMNPILKE